MKVGSKTKHILYGCATGIIILLVGLFCCRSLLFRHVADKKIGRLEQRFGLDIHYNSLQFKGLSTVSLRGMSIVPLDRDTLLTLQTLDIRFSLWKALTGQPDINNVLLDDLGIRFIKRIQ